jgi:hypothetical protein
MAEVFQMPLKHNAHFRNWQTIWMQDLDSPCVWTYPTRAMMSNSASSDDVGILAVLSSASCR